MSEPASMESPSVDDHVVPNVSVHVVPHPTNIEPSAERAATDEPATPTKVPAARRLRAWWAARRDPNRTAHEAAMPKPRLTGDEIREALRINSPSLVEEIHAIALRQNLTEDARETRLDGKAQGLLVTAGLSLTVAFTFGGILLQHPEYLKPLGNGLADTVLVLFALALVFGLLASVFAVLAQFVTGDYRSAAERDVFNLAELDAAEKAATEKTATTDQNVVDDKRAQTRYRRYMTIQYWQIWQQHFAIHERKARRIKWGQKFFLGFLVALLLIGVATAYSAFGRHEDPKSQQVQP